MVLSYFTQFCEFLFKAQGTIYDSLDIKQSKSFSINTI